MKLECSSQLLARQKRADFPLWLACERRRGISVLTAMNETPKKIPFGGKLCILCKKSFPVAKEKINVFGKSSLNICSLVKHATNIDLSVYVECENLAICRTKCYNRLVRLKNTLNKVDEITREIQNDFDGDVSLRFKRLSKDSSDTPDAKRGLNFGGPGSSSDQGELQGKVTASVVHTIPVTSPNLSPIPLGGILAYGFVPSRPQSQLVQKAFTGAMPVKTLFTSTPLGSKAATRENHHAHSPNPGSQESETSVHLTVKYPSKPIHKELKDDYAAIGKAIVYGSPQRIARAVLKNEALKKCIVEKVLQLMTLQLNGLCSRRQPSMLRANTKEGITQFDFKKLCFEWKERAPIFYAFLMTCASTKKQNNPDWLPSVSVAGSILLKQRNPHMNGCAAILGILLKSNSLEVRLNCFNNKTSPIFNPEMSNNDSCMLAKAL